MSCDMTHERAGAPNAATHAAAHDFTCQGLSETLGGKPEPGDDMAWREAGFAWTLLARHGKRPARFLGRELLRGDNRAVAAAGHLPYWSDIQVFELHGGGFVVAVRHLAAEDGRACWQDCWMCADPSQVVVSLRNHGSAGAWPQHAPGSDMALRLRAWLGLVRALFGDARAA